MDRPKGIQLNASLATTKQRGEESRSPFYPTNPPSLNFDLPRAESYDKVIISGANPKTKVPTEILLTWRVVGLNPAGAELFYQPAGKVIAEAAIVDKVIPRLLGVERRTLERHDRPWS